MKTYLFLLLIGLAFSFNCLKEYIQEKTKGTVSNFLLFKSCSCPAGFKGLIEEIEGTDCTCFLKEDLERCEADSRCTVMWGIGCGPK